VSGGRQGGLALVTILLVMALLTALVAGMLRSHQWAIGGVGRQIEASGMLQLALAGERQAVSDLRRQAAELSQVVHAGQSWARPRTLMLEQGLVRVSLEDLAGRFNLAGLVASGTAGTLSQARWERLCRSLKIEPPSLAPLAGKALLDPVQLLTLPGVSDAVLARLKPWMVVLPLEAGLNVNTAPAPVLGALEAVSPSTAQRLVENRPEEGFPSVQRFLAQPALDGLGTRSDGLAVTSRWFRLEVQADYQGRRMYLYSDLEIDALTQQVQVVRRFFSAVRERTPDE